MEDFHAFNQHGPFDFNFGCYNFNSHIYKTRKKKNKFNLIIYFLQSLKDKFVPTSMLTCTQVDILVSKMCKNQMEVNNIGSLN
jgi:hypothetical protein